MHYVTDGRFDELIREGELEKLAQFFSKSVARLVLHFGHLH